MNLRISNENSNMLVDESLSNDTRDNSTDQPAYAFSEVATLNAEHYLFEPQEQFGRAYRKDDILMFHITVSEPENIAYLIDLYTYSNRAETGEPPYHLGYHYLLPSMLKKSEGQLELPITCASKHRPLGMMKVEYVKITPLNDPNCDMKARVYLSITFGEIVLIANIILRFHTFVIGIRNGKALTSVIVVQEPLSKPQVEVLSEKTQLLLSRRQENQEPSS